jgi:hypothetical protein
MLHKPNEEEPTRSLRLRQMTDRPGLMLRKSRRRDLDALDFNDWWLIDPDTHSLVAGDR